MLGRKNVVTNALSRRPLNRDKKDKEEEVERFLDA